MLLKQQKRLIRHRRVRAKISGTSKVPRLCVFKSEKHIYAQLINDQIAETIVASSDLELEEASSLLPPRSARELKEDKSSSSPTELSQEVKVKKKAELSSSFAATREFKKNRGTKIEKAKEVGKLIAKKAKDLKIERVVFDRGGYKYHGRVKALAEGARVGGLQF